MYFKFVVSISAGYQDMVHQSNLSIVACRELIDITKVPMPVDKITGLLHLLMAESN